MKKMLILSALLAVLAGCEQPQQPQQPQSSGSVPGKVESVVFNNKPIYFADGTGLQLKGKVHQEVFVRLPDNQKQFRYQEGVRRSIRVYFDEDMPSVIKSITEVMKSGGYADQVKPLKDGMVSVNYVKRGFPVVNVRYESATEPAGQKQSLVIINWTI